MSPAVFDPELASIAVARTTLCDIDGEAGDLVVAGYPIEELADNASYEEAVFLLFEDRLPTDEELDAFRADLAGRRGIDETVLSLLAAAVADDRSPMATLRMGAAAAGLGVDATDPEAAARRVVAVLPTLVAADWRLRQDEAPIEPRDDLGHAANYLYMLTGEEPDEAAVRGLETFLVTAIEHGLNTSTFAARTVVSTDSDPVSAATAAVGALKGPRHGDFRDIHAMLRAAADADDAEAVVRDRLDGEEPLLGFWHPVYRTRDPRATVLAAAADRLAEATGDWPLRATADAVEAAVTDVLASEQPERQVTPTLEFHAVPLFLGLELSPSLFTPTFAVARAGGWMAHCLEQLADDRLVRPQSRYVGETDGDWQPIDQRQAVGDALLQSTSLEPISETLSTLSEPSRLEILLALHDSTEPLPYSRLRGATSIEDKGRFNYHLRQLREYFVADGEEGYTLTDAGRRVVDTVLAGDAPFDPE